MYLQIDYDEEVFKDLIKKGVSLLKTKKHHSQRAIVNKFKYLKLEVSAPTFSNILNGHNVSPEKISKAAEGVLMIIEQELGMIWDKNKYILDNKKEDWSPQNIPGLSIKDPSLVLKPGFSFSENGRYELSKKVAFFSEAKTEVIEIGIAMRTYSSHFFSRNDIEFRNPIVQLLKKGVNVKCYLLDPDCNEARLYFEDRGRVLPDEKKGIERIKESIRKLRKVMNEFDEIGYPGRFEVYTYRHIPSHHFMSIDGGDTNGKMFVSPYIYGVLRAKCPVIEFTKEHNPVIYRRYLDSLLLLTKDARLISLDEQK